MQMYHVGLAKLGQACDVRAARSDINGPQPVEAEPVGNKNPQPFPCLVPFSLTDANRRHGVCLLIAHKHLGLHAIIYEGATKTVGCNSRAAASLAGTYYQDSHLFLRYKDFTYKL